MKLTIESTEQVVAINGVMCRVWRGVTEEHDISAVVFVHKIAIDFDAERRRLERSMHELTRMPAAPQLVEPKPPEAG